MIHTGSLVIYHTQPALVEGLNAGKYAIRTASGDSKSVREKDLGFELYPGPVSRVPSEGAKMTASPEEVLEFLEMEPMNFHDFTELAFGSFTPETALGSWNVLQEKLYFEFDRITVTPRPRESIQADLAAKKAKEQAKRLHEELIRRIKSGVVTPPDRPFLNEIELVALGINSASRLMKDLGMEALPETAHKLLLKLGVWDLTRDPFPSRAGVPMDDPAFPLPNSAVIGRVDLTALPAYAIDDENSNDPDDALSWKDGLLYVHIADPAAAVVFGSQTELTARERGENLYVPEKIVHMMPPEATMRFGLGLNDVSPALTFVIRFQEDGQPELEKLYCSSVGVTRLTYETAAPVLDGPELDGLRGELEKFRQYRADHGALFIRMPEVKIKLDENGELSFIPCPVTPEREFVANAMLAAGAAVSKWAEKNQIPFPFVRQEPPEGCIPGEPVPQKDDLCSMYALRRQCSPGLTDTIAGTHAGLGLTPYSRVTSPLRRYSDLLAHIQIHRFLDEMPLLTDEEMTEALKTSEDAALIRRKLERLVNEYWTLVHLKRNMANMTLHLQLVYKQDDRSFFLCEEFAYEYKSRFNGDIGRCYRGTILSCEPETFSLRLKLEPEE